MEWTEEFKKKILKGIKEEDCVKLLKELVPTGQPEAEDPLDPDMPGAREEEFSKFVAGKLEEMGFNVTMPAGCEGRPNVVGVIKGTEGKPTLILNDHLDTYPAGDPKEWTMTGFNPYNPTVVGRRLYARGTSDTRGNMVCLLIALRTLLKMGVKFKGDLICAFTVDEEKNGFAGSRFILEEKGITADYSITAEPTSWTSGDEKGIWIAVAHSGHCLVEVEVKTTQSHIWRPDVGINAISKMSKIVAALEKMKFTHKAPKIYGPTKPMVCLVRVEGGRKGESQFSCHRCKLRIAVVGLVPGMTRESVLADIRKAISKVQQQDKDKYEVDANIMKGTLTFVPATKEVPANALHVRALSEAYEEVTGEKPELVRKHAFCDTIQFSLHGIPALTFGPGEDGWPPTNEFVDLDKVMIATKTFALAIPRILGVAE